MLTFDYGPLLGHGQPDKMGVTLFANGKLWAADYGTPSYASKILPWYRSTFSHNTIMVDGVNQKKTTENNVSLWLGDPTVEAARSETAQAYPGVVHSRTVVRVRDYFVIVDQLKSEETHAYDFYFRAEGVLTLNKIKTTSQATTAPVQWIEDLTAREPTRSFSGNWSEAGKGLAIWLGANNPMTPISGKCPAESGSRKIDILIARQTAREAEFIAVLRPFVAKPPKLSVKKDGHKLEIKTDSFVEVLTLPETASPIGYTAGKGKTVRWIGN
jgi:hypothetical protein